jgi:hypothetical protein
MIKKVLLGVVALYVAVSLGEWASRLIVGEENGVLENLWRIIQPVIHFVYNIGWFVRHVIKIIRIEDGVASFIDTFMFVCRVLAAWVDFLCGMLGYDFFDSKLVLCMYEKIPYIHYQNLFSGCFVFAGIVVYLTVIVVGLYGVVAKISQICNISV